MPFINDMKQDFRYNMAMEIQPGFVNRVKSERHYHYFFPQPALKKLVGA